MRLQNYSLRRGIVVQLAILILAAMLFIHHIMLKVSERDLLRSKIVLGRVTAEALAASAGGSPLPAFPGAEAERLLQAGGFAFAVIVDGQGRAVFRAGTPPDDAAVHAAANAREALITRDRRVSLAGRSWGVTWFAHEWLHVAAPVLVQGRLAGAVDVGAHLPPLYGELRRAQGVLLLVILLNTIVLVLVGMLLLHRTVIGPIHGLLDITRRFRGESRFPDLPEAPRNEIGRLFGSLSGMVRRLEENRSRLRETIASLERAYQALRKARDEMMRSEKLASVGRLATGVAHEIGNPLSIVQGYLELLRNEDPGPAQRKDFLDRTESEIGRIGKTIRQLQDFASPGSGEHRPIRAHDLLRDALDMLGPHLERSGVRVESLLEAAEDRIRTDPDRLRQVVLNLAMNGADAMAGDAAGSGAGRNGVLTIRTANREGRLEIRFQDTGGGIAAEELDHIFDPFYTTKDPGAGSGLGLSVCHRIVEDLGGRIRAQSSPGAGATFTVVIPLEAPPEDRGAGET